MKRILSLTAALTIAATSLPAQSFQGEIKFLSGSGVGSPQVGPYLGQILGLPGAPVMDIYCVDFVNSVWKTTWTANFTSIADLMGGSGFSDTRLTSSSGTRGSHFRRMMALVGTPSPAVTRHASASFT